eukprot:8305-Pleurochrysis_carterae.AAC.2
MPLQYRHAAWTIQQLSTDNQPADQMLICGAMTNLSQSARVHVAHDWQKGKCAQPSERLDILTSSRQNMAHPKKSRTVDKPASHSQRLGKTPRTFESSAGKGAPARSKFGKDIFLASAERELGNPALLWQAGVKSVCA